MSVAYLKIIINIYWSNANVTFWLHGTNKITVCLSVCLVGDNLQPQGCSQDFPLGMGGWGGGGGEGAKWFFF